MEIIVFENCLEIWNALLSNAKNITNNSCLSILKSILLLTRIIIIIHAKKVQKNLLKREFYMQLLHILHLWRHLPSTIERGWEDQNQLVATWFSFPRKHDLIIFEFVILIIKNNRYLIFTIFKINFSQWKYT